ncbi:MAG TPA: glycine--tRNA ligase [Planctomycetota bacterium]|nr:glycine--tRNA ligase [Planctomycetota bacterium]
MPRAQVTLDKVVSLAKRRGFVFQASEIYGGFESTWDYGPLGVELKRRIADAWWRDMVMAREDVVGLDSAILQAPKVWEVSGHATGFNDPLVDCKTCKGRFRADKLAMSQCPRKPSKHPGEHTDCALTAPRQFNMMFKTQVGPVEDSAAVAYLRPETAQGIFTNFLNVQQTMRMKLPFGVAQIGKSFRNEIVTGNFLFRTREFEQMEMEYFCRPEESAAKFDYWVAERLRWYRSIGLREENLRGRPYEKKDLAHYAAACTDIEYQYPWGWDELEGIANRTTFDLARHSEASGKKLQWMDPDTKEWITPHVVEPAAGLSRLVLVAMLDAYDEDVADGEPRTVLRFHPRIAPITLGIFPLVKRDGMPDKAREIVKRYLDRFPVFYDEGGAIGRRYRRQDEVGTPFCATVDSETMTDGTVTIRERDSMKQERMKIEAIGDWIDGRVRG